MIARRSVMNVVIAKSVCVCDSQAAATTGKIRPPAVAPQLPRLPQHVGEVHESPEVVEIRNGNPIRK